MKNKCNLIASALLLLFVGCASTAPLPSKIDIYTPAENERNKLSHFIGIWGGKLSGALDVILVVKKIDSTTVDTIFSIGDAGGYFWIPQNYYKHWPFMIVDDSTVEFDFISGKYIFKMDDDLEGIKGYFIENKSGSKQTAYLKRISKDKLTNTTIRYHALPNYTHESKSKKDLERDKKSCEIKAWNMGSSQDTDSIMSEISRCLQADYGWKANN